jgi:hypothetical protein
MISPGIYSARPGLLVPPQQAEAATLVGLQRSCLNKISRVLLFNSLLQGLVPLCAPDEDFADDEGNDLFLDISRVTRGGVAYNTNHFPRGARKCRSR